MVTHDKPALKLHFFPMRPTPAEKLTAANALMMLNELRGDYVIQPKLNGDRVVAWKIRGSAYFQNRHGSEYSFTVNNAAAVKSLPDGTVIDGEVYQGNFYPFEAIYFCGNDLRFSGAEIRCATAKQICAEFGFEWLFAEPSAAFLAAAEKNLPKWEGFVAKRRDGFYRPVSAAHQTSADWLKLKW